MTFRVGIDTGGTHTDLVLLDENTGAVWVDKVSSTPRDPVIGVLNGIERVLATAGVSPSQVSTVIYGTTVMVNRIIQGDGTVSGLITTAGFTDVLELARSHRAGSIYNVQWEQPVPLIPRELRLGVRERIDFRGRIVEPLNEADVRQAIAAFANRGVESVAICLLHSYKNDLHEQRIAALVRENLPQAYISVSSDLSPTIGEYERASTAAVDAFVKPRLAEHFAHLEDRLRNMGIDAVLLTMQGNGGTMSFDAARRQPIRVTNSGPVAGVIAGAAIARNLDLSAVITLDMGGTSTDVALVLDGAPIEVPSDAMQGHPVQQPAIEVDPIGAGGGSIAWVDDGGALRVGPESAGAHPGPAAYSEGGIRPTVTDAALALGYLGTNAFLGGRRTLNRDAAVRAIETVAEPLGMSMPAVASGIMALAAASSLRAIRRLTIARGHDPRDMALIAFGGAGGLIAAALAHELGTPRLVIPENPGNSSALGLLLTDQRHDVLASFLTCLGETDIAALNIAFGQLERGCALQLEQDNVAEDFREIRRFVELRYLGQTFELIVPCPPGPITGTTLASLESEFHRLHESRYGHASRSDPIELVNLRVTGIGKTFSPRPVALAQAEDGVTPSPRTTRPAYFGTWLDVPVFARASIRQGDSITGPAIIEESGSTTVLPPGNLLEPADDGSLLIYDLAPALAASHSSRSV
ncbi:hydantoinase/oxoprolinase family protein [Cryobacterium sp. PH31-O1]|uniref:hydantoinase/oxoprolinase family protein n=1 Tax=Cryobacterium sp. PH31-O1 TaxID=3046306 RepID=UPI0024BBC9B8|nr:hydantoinase/oxoprolinase family protein [Cryobacterium sp. PH31-O1]MDJ0337291.1 hydantoinase/oxoprolinase family protein [Cryobacterium sp. PH31-O1]